ncbi:MAG TPA: riboflavin biosynthesis protein RibF [Tepidisphaeraceae bacterium]|jgi:riboflavin kinase/FMN adenylyltransferase
MQVLQGIAGLKQVPAGAVLSIGNFDGIHLGHRKLLEMAKEYRARDGGEIAVVTFEPHPLTVLKPEIAPPRLTPAYQKQKLLESLGVAHYVILPPTQEILNLTAETFWQILRDDVRPRHMIEGNSFTFGKGRGGTIQRLREWSQGTPIELHILPAVEAVLLDLTVVEVNSSLIRWLIAQGRVRDAAICLGRTYQLHGTVVQGHQRGRTIGMPTANLKCDDQLVPMEGVYAGRCVIGGEEFIAAISIGTMPTFGENARQVEVHVLGFSRDLYGQQLDVQMVDWVRAQVRFNGVEALKEQMRRDLVWIRGRSGLDPSRALVEI